MADNFWRAPPMAPPRDVPPTDPLRPPPDAPPTKPVPPLPTDYVPHARQHELLGIDPVRPTVLAAGAILNRLRGLNFRTNLTVTENPTENRYDIDAAAQTDIGARVTHSAAQTLTTAVRAALAFDSERWDTNSIHDTVTNNSRLTCQTAGKYLIVGHAIFAANTAGVRSLEIRLNGGTFIGTQYAVPTAVAGFDHRVSIATIYTLSVGDYVELTAFQNSGGNLNVTVSGNESPEFAMQRIA